MTNVVIQTALLLAFGLAQCFFGYPLFRLLVILTGAIVGYIYGPEIVQLITGATPAAWTALAVAILAAVVLGYLAWKLYGVLVFLWGAGLGYSIAMSANQELWIVLLSAIVVGVFALLFQRILIVAITAIAGATLAVAAILQLGGFLPRTGTFDVASLEPWTVIVIAFLAVFGALAQFRSSSSTVRF